MVDYKNLPIYIINKIINYTGVVVYRHGKYMNRINKNNRRYNIINKKKLPIWFNKNKWLFCFKIFNGIDNRGFIMEHYHDRLNNLHYLSKKEFIKYESGVFEYENIINYIFDKQGKCRQIFNYIQ
jgi:hypothetical protein